MTAQDAFNRLRQRFFNYPALFSALPKFAEQGRIGVGINQNRSGTVYPFVTPLMGTSGLAANLDLQYPSNRFDPPFFLVRLERSRAGLSTETFTETWQRYNVYDWLELPEESLIQANGAAYTPNLYPQILIADKNNNIIVNTESLTQRRRVLVSDLDETTDCDSYYWADTDGITQLQYAEYRLANDRDAPLIFPRILEDRVPIVSRCCHPALNPVRLFGSALPSSSSSENIPLQPQELSLELSAGKSVSLRVEGQQIIIDASQPERYNGEQLEVPVKAINGLPPDVNGNFKIAGDKCFHIDRPILNTEVIPSTLSVRNDCTPCCSCDSYEKLYKIVQQLRDKLSGDIDSLTVMRQRYDNVRTKYDGYVNDVIQNNIQVVTTASKRNLIINIAVSNPVNTTTGNLIALLEFHGNSWGSQVYGTPDTFTLGSEPAMLFNTWPYYYFNTPKINAYQTAYFRLVMNFPEDRTKHRVEFYLSVYNVESHVSPTLSQSPVPGRPWGDLSGAAENMYGRAGVNSIQLPTEENETNTISMPQK